MIHISINSENIVQVNDKTRIDISKTFHTSESIKKIEVRPEVGADLIEVFDSVTMSDIRQDSLRVDWVYQTPGSESIEVVVTRDDDTTKSETKSIEILSIEQDKLFSNDDHLRALESEIERFLPEGKDSFNYLHRVAQNQILETLYDRGLVDINGDRLTKENIVQTKDLEQWSKFLVLTLIFEDMVVSPDDIYAQKAGMYRGYAQTASNSKPFIKIDKALDGNIEDKKVSISTGSVVRR